MFPDGRTADDDYRGLVDFNRGLDAEEGPGLLDRLFATGRMIGRGMGEVNDVVSSPRFSDLDAAQHEIALMMDPREGIDQSIRSAQDGDYVSALAEGAMSVPLIASVAKPAKAAKVGAKLAAKGSDGPQMSAGNPLLDDTPRIRAYHGSPHDFDRFDLSKIGTGEGAQAYGHGLYFADNEGVARGYRDALRFPKGDGTASDIRSIIADDLNYYRGDVDRARAAYEHMAAGSNPDGVKMGLKKLALLDDVIATNPGRMYEVDINADPARFLDWDAPLNRQSPEVQEALRRGPGAPTWRGQKDYFDRFPSDLDRFGNDMGGDAYRRIAGDEFGQDMAAGALRESGIPGIKYLDDNSRQWRINTDDGIKWDVGNSTTGEIREFSTRDEAAKFLESKVTRNYVVFDDSLITILRKYGVASLAALPPAVLATMGLDEQQAADMDANRAY